jgi:ketosteroid isomerase-like protein
MQTERAKLKSREDDANVARGKRSPALSYPRKMISTKATMVAAASVLAVAAIVSVSRGQATKHSDAAGTEKAVLARLGEIQNAAQGLDPEKVFSFVLENDQGALVQNGRLFLTRQDALEATKQGFQGLQKADYKFDQQHVTLLSPTIALAVGEGSSSVTTDDGRTFTRSFVQSVLLVLTNGEWKVFHAHRSFPQAR